MLENFKSLGLSDETARTLHSKGFEEPTEIQVKTIPVLMNEEVDVVGQAQTGTGKTAAFGLPLVEKLEKDSKKVQALILVPTRELAIQVSEELNSFRGKKKLHILPIYGGQSMSDQLRRLSKNADIIVGTPGRIIDHIQRKSINLNQLSYLVLDEADEMLNMGFVDDIELILETTNPDRRTLLFSATMPERIMAIARNYMKDFKILSVKKNPLTADLTDQIYFEISPADKLESLCRIIDINENFYSLIFCRTKVEVDEISSKLVDRGYDADGIHGDLSQHQRERILEKFKKKRINILVATDVAARGIDVMNLSHVINYSLPQDPESYIHRIGRTGRAGKKGIAITFISPSEYKKLLYISNITKTKIRKEKIPKASEIVEIKKSRINTDLNEIINSGGHENFLGTAETLLKDKDPIETVAAILKYALESELDEKKYKDIAEIKAKPRGTARLFVSLGAKDGLTTRKLIKLINNESKVSAGKITEVRVMDSFSFLTVPFEEAEIIIKAFNAKSEQGKPLIQRANPSAKSGSKKSGTGAKKTSRSAGKR